jgi:hypothetical protein
MMSRLVYILLLTPILGFSQNTREIGGMIGGTYYTGELNRAGHFNPNFTHRAYGLYYREALNSRWAVRFNGVYGKVSGADSLASSDVNLNRNLSFNSRIIEGSFLVEFNFLHYHSFVQKDYFSPYLFGGLGLFHFNPIGTLNGNSYELQLIQTEGQFYRRLSTAFIIGTGIKFKFSHRILFGLEWGFRRTLTDYLDDVSGFYPEDPSNLSNTAVGLANKSFSQGNNGQNDWGSQRGNPSDKDWYAFGGLSISIRLGKNPNLCHYQPE